MLFIKNLTEAEGKEFGLSLTQGGDAMKLAIELPNDAVVGILSSSVSGIYSSMKKSLEHVGKKTRNINKTEQDGEKLVTTQLLDKYPTEVIFYVKDKKIALKKPNGAPFIPISIDLIPDEDADKRFPRDIIAIIVPKRTADGARLEYDPRNLVGKPVVITAAEEPQAPEGYQIILAMVRWPVWANLKFPVYLSVVDDEGALGSIQLASKEDNGAARNQIVDAENEEALEYLEKSKKILEEKAAEKAAEARQKQRSQKNNNNKFNGGNQRNPRQNKGNTNTKGFGGGGKNFNRNGQR